MRQTTPNNLRALRTRLGLSQRDVANYLGFSSTDRISRWEHGQMYPHVRSFIKLLELYGAMAHEVYGRDEFQPITHDLKHDS